MTAGRVLIACLVVVALALPATTFGAGSVKRAGLYDANAIDWSCDTGEPRSGHPGGSVKFMSNLPSGPGTMNLAVTIRDRVPNVYYDMYLETTGTSCNVEYFVGTLTTDARGNGGNTWGVTFDQSYTSFWLFMQVQGGGDILASGVVSF